MCIGNIRGRAEICYRGRAGSAHMSRILILLSGSASAQWTSVEFYDVLQEDCREDVTDKDMGDPAGDAFFNLKVGTVLALSTHMHPL